MEIVYVSIQMLPR